MSEDTTTPTSSTPPVHVEVTNRNHSLVGKIFHVIKEDAEWVVTEIEIAGEKFIQIFHKSEVTPVAPPAPPVVPPVTEPVAPTA